MRGTNSIAKLVMPRASSARDFLAPGVRLHEPDDHGAGFQLPDLLQGRGLHGEQHVGLPEHLRGAVGPRDAFVKRIREAGALAGTALEQYPGAFLDEFIGDLGHQADARFSRRAFAQRAYCDWHSGSLPHAWLGGHVVKNL